MLDNSFVTLHRKFLKWEWYTETNTMAVFLHLLLSANFKETRWRGETIKRGQLLTGRKILATQLNMSEKKIRTALDRLKETGEVAIKTTSKFSIVTIEKYDFYQSKDDEITDKGPAVGPTKGQQRANKGPTKGQQRATSNKVNNVNKVNKNKKVVLDDVNFLCWYELYPKKKSREDAVKAWLKLKPDKSLVDELISSLGSQIENRDKHRRIGSWIPAWPNPATWLNGKRWTDELEQPEVTNNAKPETEHQRSRRVMEERLKKGFARIKQESNSESIGIEGHSDAARNIL